MTDYTKLIERVREMSDSDGTQFEAAEAIDALQGEVEQVKGFWKEAQLRNRNLLEEGNDLAMLADQYKAERDQLQAKLDAAHAVLDSDDSKIVRNAADGYPEGREPRELALSERVEALCTYATDWKRWCEEVQSKLDELQRQQPVGRFVSDGDCGHIDLVPHQGQPLVDGQAVYAAPKALEPEIQPVNCDTCVYHYKDADQKPCNTCIHSSDFVSNFEPRITKGTP